MAFTKSKTVAIVTCLMAIWAVSPTEAVDCSSVILSLADCLTFVTNGSTIEKPEGGCCSGLKTVLKASPECLCVGFRSSAQFGVKLNITKALSLPSACHVSAPSVTSCGPATAPRATPRAAQAPKSTPPAHAPGSASAPRSASSTPAPVASTPSPSTSSDSGNVEVPAPPPGNSGSAPVCISFITAAVGLFLTFASSR